MYTKETLIQSVSNNFKLISETDGIDTIINFISEINKLFFYKFINNKDENFQRDYGHYMEWLYDNEEDNIDLVNDILDKEYMDWILVLRKKKKLDDIITIMSHRNKYEHIYSELVIRNELEYMNDKLATIKEKLDSIDDVICLEEANTVSIVRNIFEPFKTKLDYQDTRFWWYLSNDGNCHLSPYLRRKYLLAHVKNITPYKFYQNHLDHCQVCSKYLTKTL